jgi:hypothetical protein
MSGISISPDEKLKYISSVQRLRSRRPKAVDVPDMLCRVSFKNYKNFRSGYSTPPQPLVGVFSLQCLHTLEPCNKCLAPYIRAVVYLLILTHLIIGTLRPPVIVYRQCLLAARITFAEVLLYIFVKLTELI